MVSTSHRNFQSAIRLSFVGLLLALFMAQVAYSQTIKGTIFGTVTDSSGAVVPDAKVTVTALSTNTTREVQTGQDGSYVVPLLPPGKYRVRVEKQGFAARLIESVDLVVDARLQVDMKLSVGGAKQEVTVTGAAAAVNTGSASVGQLIAEKAIVDLPLNGRNFLQLVLLSAGTTPLGAISDAASFNRPSVNISGGRESSNQFTIDGVFDNSIHFEGLNLQPNIDSLQEFNVQRNTFSAEFGHGTAMVNVATKSGTNQFHGTAYEFIRNDALDAKQYFDTTKPPYRQNQFGFTFGGPILKNNTFFFVSYEGYRSRRSLTLIGTLPTGKMLSGDFSGLGPVTDPTTGMPFPGNVIPSSRFSAVTKRILPFLPQPATAGANNYNVQRAFSNNFDQFSIRLDHTFGSKDTVFVRYNGAYTNQYSPGLIAYSGYSVTDTPVNATGQWTHLLSSSLANDLRIGFNRNLQDRLQDGANNSDLNVLQFTNIVDSPVNYGIPLIVMAGYTGVGTSLTFPEIVGGNTYQYDDTFTWVKGRHTFKFGADIRNTQMPHTPFLASRGEFVFLGLTGNPVADFLLGNPLVSLGAGKGPSAYMSMLGTSFFAQDDFRVSRNLTLNLGLRYDRLSALSDRTRGRLGVFDPVRGVVVPPDQVEADGLINPDNTNFGPRIGFAWSPFHNDKTVVRGGYGIYYDQKPLNEYNFSLGTELAFQQIVSPATQWDNLFPAANGAGVGILTDDPYAKNPMVHQYSLGVQRALPYGMVLEADYVGSAGRHLNNRYDLNQAVLGPGSIQSRRPYPTLGSIYSVNDTAYSNYNSLQTKLERRFTKNLYFLVGYTFAKSLDTSSVGAEAPQNSHNIDAEYGRSVFDQKHRLTLSYSYQLPFGKGQTYAASASRPLDLLIGGWQWNGILTLSSGVPFSVGVGGTDRSETGTFSGGFQRANLVGRNNGNSGGLRTPTQWFNTSAFQLAPIGTFGDSGRNIVIGPRTNNIDMSLFKTFTISERARFEIRAEFFNAFNHTQFNLPNADPSSPAFGEISSAKDARQIQFGAKIIF